MKLRTKSSSNDWKQILFSHIDAVDSFSVFSGGTLTESVVVSLVHAYWYNIFDEVRL